MELSDARGSIEPCEILRSHSGEYEAQNLLGSGLPDDGGSTYL
jgi:hypothetical protein